jgi:hypothetical protein
MPGSLPRSAIPGDERMMIDQFDEMLVQSKKWPLVCTIVIHPFIIGYPFRLRALRRGTHL